MNSNFLYIVFILKSTHLVRFKSGGNVQNIRQQAGTIESVKKCNILILMKDLKLVLSVSLKMENRNHLPPKLL